LVAALLRSEIEAKRIRSIRSVSLRFLTRLQKAGMVGRRGSVASPSASGW
jgi:hypothetical protein